MKSTPTVTPARTYAALIIFHLFSAFVSFGSSYPVALKEVELGCFNNASAHRADKITDYLHTAGTELLEHPPYSPDLAPCVLALFAYLKKNKAKQVFERRGDMWLYSRKISYLILRNFLVSLRSFRSNTDEMEMEPHGITLKKETFKSVLKQKVIHEHIDKDGGCAQQHKIRGRHALEKLSSPTVMGSTSDDSARCVGFPYNSNRGYDHARIFIEQVFCLRLRFPTEDDVERSIILECRYNDKGVYEQRAAGPGRGRVSVPSPVKIRAGISFLSPARGKRRFTRPLTRAMFARLALLVWSGAGVGAAAGRERAGVAEALRAPAPARPARSVSRAECHTERASRFAPESAREKRKKSCPQNGRRPLPDCRLGPRHHVRDCIPAALINMAVFLPPLLIARIPPDAPAARPRRRRLNR
ncbi:hypothetical protein EVAR_89283_1 [Eumeta japonica]|uniref:Mariner Mos1 transposase n=1 Tax=Eumeta variegata TaxID=151549 RepID=A0A4C1YYH2_EUMVA|nr:hypothetical protein EVAR_89283_1 [Eumeta japonica]